MSREIAQSPSFSTKILVLWSFVPCFKWLKKLLQSVIVKRVVVQIRCFCSIRCVVAAQSILNVCIMGL